MSFRVVSEHSVAKALQTLENCVLYMMKTFGSQSVANTLHGMSEQRYTSSETLLLTLEGRVEEISGEFNPRDVTNTLWESQMRFAMRQWGGRFRPKTFRKLIQNFKKNLNFAPDIIFWVLR